SSIENVRELSVDYERFGRMRLTKYSVVQTARFSIDFWCCATTGYVRVASIFPHLDGWIYSFQNLPGRMVR
ncbi:MAG: hypothetical protein ACREBQ_03000, partial [Nitrososphaerales archaeon]